MVQRRLLISAAAVFTAATLPWLAAGTATAQPAAWPQRPIRLVVPFPPGGSADFLGRLVAEKITVATGWTVIVENRAGAAGNIGLDAVARAPADGYTFGIGQTANMAINPSLYAKMPFDPLKDLVPIALVASQPMVVTVKADSPFRTMADLVAAAKKRPDPMRVAFAGNGTVGHLAIELLERRAGITLLNVPYKGAGPAVNDLRAGRWSRAQDGLELQGRTLGLVGFGAVGRRVAAVAMAMGMRVVAFDPSRPAAPDALHGVRILPTLDAVVESADVLSLHVPLNAATRGFIDADRIARMRPGAILINTARGEVVDEPALIAALRSGHLRAAGLDTMSVEPLPAGHPLLSLPNVVLTPHVGGSTPAALDAMALGAARTVLDFLKRRTLDPAVCINASRLPPSFLENSQ